ncbi:MAG TPA: hypothetical protein VM285_15625 [Polyangia bacterium]|nr:hypothetical protein [Polyangia bacterium]
MRKLFVAILAVAVIGVAGFQARAEVPFLIPVVGVLTDTDDAPLEGSLTVVFTLYTAETGGVTLWGETQTVEFEDGLFRVYLGSETMGGLDITDFVDNESVWLGVRVGADGEMNRVRMASVPWAFEAETCGQVTDLGAAGIQGAIGADACATGFAMRGWTGSSAVCVALPDTSGLVADTDIGVTVQAPISQVSFPCNYGIQQIGVDGSTVCANQDVVTQCGPEAGLGSDDNYLGSDGACHKAAHSCTADQYLAGGATGTCQEAPHKCSADQYLDGDGTCQEAPHKCEAGQYLDGDGSCTSMAISGTAGTLAVFTDGTSVGDSIITQSGTTDVSVAGTLSTSGNVSVGGRLDLSGRTAYGTELIPGDGSWGNWGGIQYCPEDTYVCGIRVRIEPDQGGGDDSAMNGVRLTCCYFGL